MKKDIAPSGKLRLGLNYQNFLLCTGEDAKGLPTGIAPDLGRELAKRLGVEVEYFKYDAAGKLFDAVKSAQVDVGFLGAEPARASEVNFTTAYLELPVTFLVPPGSKIRTLADVDKEGVRVSVSERSAYDLYLTRTLKKATLVRVGGIPASYDAFVAQKLEALGGLKPRLVEDQKRLPGSVILDGQITAVQQAVGAPKGRNEAAKYLQSFVDDVKKSGLVAKLVDNHQVKGVNVAP
jgi:polar amino acid transport system substrate-binding protein